MKSISMSVTVFLCFLSKSFGSFGIEPATVDPRYPNQCYSKETRKYHEDGESWQIKGCGLASCIKITQSSSQNSQMMISYEGCGSVGYEPPCYTTVSKGAEFPDCCPEVVCPDSGEESEIELHESVDNELVSHSKNRYNQSQSQPLTAPVDVRNSYEAQDRKEGTHKQPWGASPMKFQSLDSNNDNDYDDEEKYSSNDLYNQKASNFFYLY